jgi:hypothetical protein
MKLKVLPYKSGSKSAKEIVRSLSPLAIMKKQTTPVVGRSKVLLNWGHSSPSFSLSGVTVLNKPNAVSTASNKLTALTAMKAAGVRVPEFTNDVELAKSWIEDERIVLCRKLLRANSGRGIVVAKTVEELVSAPLYVKYIRKEKEYRLHVFNGKVIDFVEKKKRRGFEENPVYNKYIRSYEQGWVMVRDGVTVSDATKVEAVKAVAALGLDFGAVDIVIDREGLPVVLEVNTAPGIQGTTLAKYKEAIKEWMGSL